MLDENVETRPDFLELEQYLSQICVSEPDLEKHHKSIPPMMMDVEDSRGESVYPEELADVEVVDKIDGEEEEEYEMPRVVVVGGQGR